MNLIFKSIKLRKLFILCLTILSFHISYLAYASIGKSQRISHSSNFKSFGRKPYLVFANAGLRSTAAVKSWTQGRRSARNYDIVLNYFEHTKTSMPPCAGDICFSKPGFKWPCLAYFLKIKGLKSTSYRAIFAIDDDIIMNTTDIVNLFEVFTEYELHFAQPSYLGQLSDLHFPRIQRWRGNTILRYTNFVENAAMVLRFDLIFDKLFPILEKSRSGWGVDYCFFQVCDADVTDIATIHTARAIHPPAKSVTKASNAYGVQSKSLNRFGAVTAARNSKSKNRREGEELMKYCGAFMFKPKVFFRISPTETKEEALLREEENLPFYRGQRLVRSPW